MISRRVKLSFYLLALVIIGLIIFYPQIFKPVESFSYRLVSKPAGKLNLVFGQTKSIFSAIFSVNRLNKETAELERENLELKSRLSKMEEIEYQNQLLRSQIGFVESNRDHQYLAAEVIGRSPISSRKIITLSIGEKQGVRLNQAVVYSGMLVGKIIEASPDSSFALLITDANSLTPAVLNSSRGNGILKGGIGGLVIDEVPLDIQKQEGEMVVTSGIGNELPAGIAIGEVAETISTESSIFQKIRVQSPVDFNKLEVVLIVKK